MYNKVKTTRTVIVFFTQYIQYAIVRLPAVSTICMTAIIVVLFASCAQHPNKGTTTPQHKTQQEKQKKTQQLNLDDACSIYTTNPQWLDASLQASSRHQTPIFVYLAFIHQESRFNPEARPRSKNGKLLSSAYGYAQALDGTWKEYQQETGNTHGKRNTFSDAVDFIGWYIFRVHTSLGVSKWRADILYLSYHEGIGGYKRGLHKKKPWLIQVAAKVQKRAQMYHQQLLKCGIPIYLERDGSIPQQYQQSSQINKQNLKKRQSSPFFRSKSKNSSRKQWH